MLPGSRGLGSLPLTAHLGCRATQRCSADCVLPARAAHAALRPSCSSASRSWALPRPATPKTSLLRSAPSEPSLAQIWHEPTAGMLVVLSCATSVAAMAERLSLNLTVAQSMLPLVHPRLSCFPMPSQISQKLVQALPPPCIQVLATLSREWNCVILSTGSEWRMACMQCCTAMQRFPSSNRRRDICLQVCAAGP